MDLYSNPDQPLSVTAKPRKEKGENREERREKTEKREKGENALMSWVLRGGDWRVHVSADVCIPVQFWMYKRRH